MNEITKKYRSQVKDNNWESLDLYLGYRLEQIPITLLEDEKPKKLTEQQKKLKDLLDKNATNPKTFSGNAQELKQIEQYLNTKEVLKGEDHIEIWDSLYDMAKASGGPKLYSQCLIGHQVKIYLEEKSVEASTIFFGKSKSQLYKYVKLTEFLINFPRLSVIGADFTLLVQKIGFIKEYIKQKNDNFGKISLDAEVTVKTEFDEQMENT